MASVNHCELRIENIVDRLYGEVFCIRPAASRGQVILTHLTEKWMTREQISRRGPYLLAEEDRASGSDAEKGKQSELISTLYGQSNTSAPKRDSMSRRRDLIDLIGRHSSGGGSQVIRDIISANTRWITDRLSCLDREEQAKKLDTMRSVFLDYLDRIPQAEAQAREDCRKMRIRQGGAAGAEGGDNIDDGPLGELLDYVRRQFQVEPEETHLRIVGYASGLSWLFLGAALRKAINRRWDLLRSFLEEPQQPEKPALPEVPMHSEPPGEAAQTKSMPGTTKEIDLHAELAAKFQDLDRKPRPELTPAQKRKAEMDRQDALDLLMFQASEKEDPHRSSASGTGEEAGEQVPGKYFSMLSPVGVCPIIYQIDRMALPERHRGIYVTERLDYALELLENRILRFTYFVENPAPDGNFIIMLTFFQDTNQVHINSGFLDYDQVKFSKAPIVLNTRWNKIGEDGTLPPELGNHFTMAPSASEREKQEFAYTFDPEKLFVILEMETTEQIKPELYRENGVLRGRIFLKPNKKYCIFKVRSERHDGSFPLSDYRIGMAYKNGTMKLRTDYAKAREYLKTAASEGNADAYEALADLYERGLGCVKNPARAEQMRREARALRCGDGE